MPVIPLASMDEAVTPVKPEALPTKLAAAMELVEIRFPTVTVPTKTEPVAWIVVPPTIKAEPVATKVEAEIVPPGTVMLEKEVTGA